ncbi:prephenate dehydratase [Bifidobacterium samirii]|uniref:Prephenate dehydratase n=1 Tax=Bifidobacterium samirii TaxID=2306974 RepID=A0A430FU89_9BIFI|nr:prephenate dehydratase domain-containing protein [Bifidobacterium samirii]RSX56698.1 chorismate mutase [Bifidobacterium samirii]
MRTLHYLGPEGTFTHQAAMTAADLLRPLAGDDGTVALQAEPGVPAILDAVQSGGDWGVIAWENNIEGYVVPNLDALIDARDTAGFARVGVDVSFDAFVRPAADDADAAATASDAPTDDVVPPAVAERLIARCATVTAHPHGLAQCRRFAAAHGLTEKPASSNGAACRDLEPGQVALGPRICGELYGLTRVARAVEDYPGAHTEFLVLAPRGEVAAMTAALSHAGTGESGAPDTPAEPAEYESIVAFILLDTGPGVLANLLDVLRDAGLNMTSFISRPVKGHDGTYSFIATFDAAPWQPHFRAALEQVVQGGDWVKTLAVYPRRERPNPPVDAWMLPEGGVLAARGDGADDTDAGWAESETTRKELLW